MLTVIFHQVGLVYQRISGVVWQIFNNHVIAHLLTSQWKIVKNRPAYIAINWKRDGLLFWITLYILL